jgi:hypothetical protein
VGTMRGAVASADVNVADGRVPRGLLVTKYSP